MIVISRSELSPAHRRSLGRLVSALFDGATVVIGEDGKDVGRKFLCFRMAGEELPVVDKMAEAVEANQAGLFMTGESYPAGMGPGTTPSSRVWLGTGSLDEILQTLGVFGDVGTILDQFQHALSVRAALNSLVGPDAIGDQGVLEIVPPPSRACLLDDLRTIADEVFEAYDFGDAKVVAHDGWSSSQSDSRAVEMNKTVYVSYPDDAPGADSHKVSFKVTFDGPDVADAYALETRHGDEIGSRGDSYVKPNPEAPRER